MPIMSNPSPYAVFLDRDGTLIEDRGDLSQPSQVVFLERTVEALRRLQSVFSLFIVTNQSGVGKGNITVADVARVNAYVVSCLADAGIQIMETYVCPHRREDACQCAKPNPYFLNVAARDYGIDLVRSFVVGDHPHDVTFGRNAGAGSVYVLTGHGLHHCDALSPDTVIAEDLLDAATVILKQHAKAAP